MHKEIIKMMEDQFKTKVHQIGKVIKTTVSQIDLQGICLLNHLGLNDSIEDIQLKRSGTGVCVLVMLTE